MRLPEMEESIVVEDQPMDIASMVLDRRSGSHWCIIVAALGYLSTSLPLLANQGPPYLIEHPDLHGIAIGSPAVENGGQWQRAADQGKAPQPGPAPPVVQDQAEAPSGGDGSQDAERREEQRADDDLAAQQSMAESARIMLWLTGWQIAIGVIGTGLVLAALWYTARATNAAVEANRLNRKTFIADQRPWLKVGATIGDALQWNINGLNITLVFKIENTGNSPALHAEVQFWPIIDPDQVNLGKAQAERAASAGKDRPAIGYTIFPSDTAQLPVSTNILRENFVTYANSTLPSRGKAFLNIVGLVIYRNAFDEELHQTGFIYQVMRKTSDGWSPFIGPVDVDIPANELALRGWFQPGLVT